MLRATALMRPLVAAVAVAATLTAGLIAAPTAGAVTGELDEVIFVGSATDEPHLRGTVESGDIYIAYTGTSTISDSTVINGDIHTRGSIHIAGSALVRGNVYANGAVTFDGAGRVEGSVYANSHVAAVGGSRTVVAGDVCATSIDVAAWINIGGTRTTGAGCTNVVNRGLPTFTYNPADWFSPTRVATVAVPAPNGWTSPTWSITDQAGAWEGTCEQFLAMGDYSKAGRWSNLPLIALSGTYRIVGGCDTTITNNWELHLAGDTALIVDGGFSVGGSSKIVATNGAANLYIMSTGGGTIDISGSATSVGDVVVFAYTQGRVTLTGTGITTVGQIYADTVHVAASRSAAFRRSATPPGLSGGIYTDDGANVTVAPTISCARDDNGDTVVLLGHTNNGTSSYTIVVGAHNQITAGVPLNAQPTLFAPGTHHNTWSVRVGAGDSFAWHLDGNTVALDSNTTICDDQSVPMLAASGAGIAVTVAVGAGALCALWVIALRRPRSRQ